MSGHPPPGTGRRGAIIPGSSVSGYFDLRAPLFRRGFEEALPYDAYLATGDGRERRAWARAADALPPLPEEAAARLDPAGRIVRVLCLSGIWCGDCSRSVPVLARLAEAAGPPLELRILDRDAIPELRDELRLLGAMRVPVAVCLTEDFHEIGRFGDRPLSVYRDKAATELGAACPLPGTADDGAIAAEAREWLDFLERMILMARLCPPLRARHGD